MHTSTSGVADYLAENDRHAIQICRNIFESIPGSIKQVIDRTEIRPPAYDPSELYGLAPQDLKKTVDARELIMRFVDGGSFNEFKEQYAPTIVTVWSLSTVSL